MLTMLNFLIYILNMLAILIINTIRFIINMLPFLALYYKKKILHYMFIHFIIKTRFILIYHRLVLIQLPPFHEFGCSPIELRWFFFLFKKELKFYISKFYLDAEIVGFAPTTFRLTACCSN